MRNVCRVRVKVISVFTLTFRTNLLVPEFISAHGVHFVESCQGSSIDTCYRVIYFVVIGCLVYFS